MLVILQKLQKNKMFLNKAIEKNFIDLILTLKKNGITNEDVLRVIEKIPRSIFIECSIQSKSHLNIALPIDCGQTISQPLVVAHMTQELELNKKLRVLEIGTGSGYQTSILSKLSRFVYSVERYKTLKELAESKFKYLKLSNIYCKHADGGLGWNEQSPFDRIIVTASAPEIPNALINQLSDNGIMLIPLGDENNDQTLVKVTKNKKSIKTENLFNVRFVPLLEGKMNK